MIQKRAIYVLGLVLAALLFGLFGCGGGHGTATGGSNTGSTMTEQTRTTALNAVSARYDSLPQTSAKDDAASLLAFIKTRSEFNASGIAPDNSVWARFTDNTMLVIPLNQFPTPPGSKHTALSSPPTRTRTTGGPVELPAESTAYLINTRGVGDADVKQVFDALGSPLIGYLPNNGYKVTMLDGTIENLRTIKNAGVLYNDGPAGIGYKGTPRDLPGTPTYLLGTLTKRAPGTDAGYAADIAAGRVAYMLIPTLQTSAGSTKTYTLASMYGITDAFAVQNWTFVANALYISDSPDGAAAEAGAFRLALFTLPNGPLSVYLGWDGPVANRDANESSLFLFDRLTASNDLTAARQPESPMQRPFNFQQILGQMATLHRTQPAGSQTDLLTSIGENSYDSSAHIAGPSSLKDFENPDESDANFGILRPTIASARIDETAKTLTLTGTFGTDPGSDGVVTIGGDDVTTDTTWTQTKLTITNLSNQASGDIVVKVRNLESNHIQITKWFGNFTATQRGPGGEKRITNYSMTLRGILNFLRSSPGGMPQENMPGALGSVYSLSGCTWDATGVDDSTNVTEAIARIGSPVIPLSNQNIIIGNPGRAASFNVALDFSTAPPKMMATAYAYVNDDGGLHITRQDRVTGAVSGFMLPYFINFSSEPVDTLDSSYNIKAGQWTSADGTNSISWGDLPALHPPNQLEERSVRARGVRQIR